MPSMIGDLPATTDAAAAQIRRLRQEVDSVMRNTVTPALTDAFERAAIATQYAGDQVRSGSDMVAGNVRNRPLVSILIAAIVGFVLGRFSA